VRFGAAQIVEHLPAVHFRHHDIQHDDVVIGLFRLEKSLFSVGGGIDGVVGLAQSFRQAALEPGLVFSDQDLMAGRSP